VSPTLVKRFVVLWERDGHLTIPESFSGNRSAFFPEEGYETQEEAEVAILQNGLREDFYIVERIQVCDE
jgi:hypothetical protein